MKAFATRTERSVAVPRKLPLTAWCTIFSLCVLLAANSGCGQSGQKYVAPPPPKVTVAKPVVKTITEYAEFTGNTKAYESVDVRARVEGFLESMEFTPSSEVKKGQLLFVIDRKPYKAQLEQAEADLASAKAKLQLAEAKLTRKQRAFKQRAVSEVDVIEARADKATAQASILAAQASIDLAKINLGYCSVTSPIDGIVSRNMVDVGNLVGSGESTLLTSVVQSNPIYAYFNVSERQLLEFRDRRRKAGINDESYRQSSEGWIFLGMANEKGYPHQGNIDYIDNTVDPTTGTISVRGKFANGGRDILPGLFVRIRVKLGTLSNAILVPDSALGMDQSGHYALVVGGDNKVERRKVEVGPMESGLRVVLSGLKAEDRVIVKGLLMARPGITVTPEETKIGGQKAGEKADGKSQGEKKQDKDKDAAKKDDNKKPKQ